VHLSAELLKYYAGVDIVHVPYRGAAAAMTALLAGDVDIMVDSVPPSLPHIRAGKSARARGDERARVPQLPEVPTMIESGFPLRAATGSRSAFAWHDARPSVDLEVRISRLDHGRTSGSCGTRRALVTASARTFPGTNVRQRGRHRIDHDVHVAARSAVIAAAAPR